MRRAAATMLVATLLVGCSGSATLRAGSAAPPATVQAPAAPSGAQGASVHVGRGLVLAVILAAMIRDGVQWAAEWFGRLFPEEAAPATGGEPAAGCGAACPE